MSENPKEQGSANRGDHRPIGNHLPISRAYFPFETLGFFGEFVSGFGRVLSKNLLDIIYSSAIMVEYFGFVLQTHDK